MNKFLNEPDVLGYWWAYEDLPPEDADWMLVFVDVKTTHYGDVAFEKSHFKKWVKADFSDELQELYENSQKWIEK